MTSLQVMHYFGYAETFTIPSDRSGMVAICVARQPPSGPEVKMGCVELCNFHFCCASIFCQPMKKFEFFGATRATRQRHSKRVALGTRMYSANLVPRVFVPYCAWLDETSDSRKIRSRGGFHWLLKNNANDRK